MTTDAKRVPLRVRLPFKTREEFVERYARHVALEGIFIATKGVKPEGTQLLFELVLADGARLMRGEGSVTRVVVSEQPGQSGMLVRFERLDAPTKDLLHEVVAHRQARDDAEAQAAAPDHATLPSAPPSAPVPEAAAEPAPIEFSASSIQAAPAPAPSDAPALEAVPPIPLTEDAIVGLDVTQPAWRAAVWHAGEVKPLPLSAAPGGEFPSGVAVDAAGKLLAGADAAGLSAASPDRAWGSPARWLGVRVERPSTGPATRRAGVLRGAGAGDFVALLADVPVAAADAAGAALGAVKDAAVAGTGRPLRRVVLAVPSALDARQRDAVVRAAQRAGLQVVRVVNDTTAAAVAFGAGRGLARKRVLVVKLGATGFGASVVDLTGDDVEVTSSTGDCWLGTEDADALVLDALIAGLPEDTQAVARSPGRQRQAALAAVRAARRELEAADAAPVTLTVAGAQLDTTLTREQQAQAVAPHTRRVVELVRQVLDGAKLTAQQIDDVVLIDGGVPSALRRELETVVGRITQSDGGALVAAGAGLVAHATLQRERHRRAATVSEVLSSPIGWVARDGSVQRLLDRNTRLPASKSFAVDVEPGASAAVLLCQGDAVHADDTQPLGAVELTVDSPAQVTIDVRVDADGRASAEARGRAATWSPAVAGLAELLPRAPASPSPPQSPKGLLGGLKKLFGR